MNAATYLVEACDAAGPRRPLRLVVHLPEAESRSESARTLPEAINNHFAYRERHLRKELARLIRYGVVSLVIGLLFLVVCIALRRALMYARFVGRPIDY